MIDCSAKECLCLLLKFHYENMPLQHKAIFQGCKNYNFQLRIFLTIFIFLLKT